jgi:alpha-amylase
LSRCLRQDPNDGPGTDWWWDHLAKQADVLARHGFTSLWLPPATKAQQGHSEAALGYSVYDDYDLGWKVQKGTVHTRYGNREQLRRCAAILRANGLGVCTDLQLNHRKGGSGADEMTFEYVDSSGNKSGGRFPKNAQCFHSRYPAGPIPPGFNPEIPQGPTIQRWKDRGVFAFERLGGTHLLVALNKDKQSGRTIHVDTGFPRCFRYRLLVAHL